MQIDAHSKSKPRRPQSKHFTSMRKKGVLVAIQTEPTLVEPIILSVYFDPRSPFHRSCFITLVLMSCKCRVPARRITSKQAHRTANANAAQTRNCTTLRPRFQQRQLQLADQATGSGKLVFCPRLRCHSFGLLGESIVNSVFLFKNE